LKFLILILLSLSLLLGNQSGDKLKMQILKNICLSIKSENKMKIWSDDINIMKSFKESDKFVTVSNFNDANFIILTKKIAFLTEDTDKHIFVLNYCLLEYIPNSFGALFWKKGRPNIVFIKSRLEDQSLILSDKLKPYIEEQIW